MSTPDAVRSNLGSDVTSDTKNHVSSTLKPLNKHSHGGSKFFQGGDTISDHEINPSSTLPPPLPFSLSELWNFTEIQSRKDNYIMTSAKHLDSNINGHTPWNKPDDQHHFSVDPFPPHSLGLMTNWNMVFNNDNSNTINEFQSALGQRTIADNHKRHPSDMSINSLLSSNSASNMEDWAAYIAASGQIPFQQRHPSSQSIWDKRSSFSSGGSTSLHRNSITGLPNEGNGGFMGNGLFVEGELQPFAPVGNATGFTDMAIHFDKSPSPLSTLNSLGGTQFNSNLINDTATNYNDQMMSNFGNIINYFGIPPQEKLDIMKSLAFFRKSLGENLPYFNISSSELNQYQFVLVCFKNLRLDLFVIRKENVNDFKEGDLVIVQADRGIDLGKIVKLDVTEEEARLLKTKQNSDQRANSGKSTEEVKKAGLDVPKEVIRLATVEELNDLISKFAEESRATKVCQEKVIEFGLNLVIEDCEYQWDKNKLTFYYQSDQRVDFRDLIRDMFRIYKARIWMSKHSGL